jgi:hypothetical protein
LDLKAKFETRTSHFETKRFQAIVHWIQLVQPHRFCQLSAVLFSALSCVLATLVLHGIAREKSVAFINPGMMSLMHCSNPILAVAAQVG